MATPGQGHKSKLAVGKESSFGAGAAPTILIEIISWNVAPQVGVIQDPSLYDKNSRRAIYQGGMLYRGTFVIRLNYAGLLELFRGVSGTYSAALVAGETLVRDHTFKEGDTLASYELQIYAGDIPTGRVFRLTGAKFTGCTIRGVAGNGNDAMLTAEFTVLAKDMVSNYTPNGTGSLPSTQPVLFHQAVTVDDGTTDTPSVRSIEVTLDNPHSEDRFFFGSQNIDEPIRSDFLTARFRIQQEFQTQTQYDAARAFTTGSPLFKFQGVSIGNASKFEFEVRANSAQLVEWSAPIEGYGIILATATWEAFFNTSDATALAYRVRSLDAALS